MKRIFALSMGMLVLSGAPSMASDVGYKDMTMPDGFQTKVKWEAWQSFTQTKDPTTGEILRTPIGQPHLKTYVKMPDGFWLLCANNGDCTEIYQEYLPWHKKESE